jgi:hypothetical protein
VALIGADWPHRLGTFAAVLAGVAAALAVGRSARQAPSEAATPTRQPPDSSAR